MTVHDSAIPSVRTTAILTVTVARNQFPPVFTENPYQVSIQPENRIGDLVGTILATDQDGVSFVLNCQVSQFIRLHTL